MDLSSRKRTTVEAETYCKMVRDRLAERRHSGRQEVIRKLKETPPGDEDPDYWPWVLTDG
jgi:hypothetical protein